MIAGNYVSFTGLKKLESGMLDYSTIKVTIEDESFAIAEYNTEVNDITLKVKNKVGSTKISFETENGIKADNCDLIINLPISDPSQFSVQIEHFEGNDNFKQSATGSTSVPSMEAIELTVGFEYTYYYNITTKGEDGEEGTPLEFHTLDGIMSYMQARSSDTTAIKISESLVA